MSEMVVRECRQEDLPQAYQLYCKLYTDYGDPVPDEGIEERMGEYLLVAEVESKIVGVVVAEKQTIAFMKSEIGRAAFPDDEDYLEVQELYVLSEYRNQGIGRKLMKTVLEQGRRNGLQRSMVYSSNEDYMRTARFYESCGYKMWHIFMTQ